MWKALLRLLRPKPVCDPDTYRAFTTRYDLVINGNEIDNFLGARSSAIFQEYASELHPALERWRARATIAAVETLTAARIARSEMPASDTVACLLVDHSGSLQGQRAILAIAIVEIIADFWHRLGIRYEILGFTTQSWQGGLSRLDWKRAGSPFKPGRLCDSLHIVYRSASDTNPGVPWAIRNLCRQDLLKENVDGEAIEWASDRLLARPEDQKILIVLSDGVPVDDSTILANDGGYLERHLRSVLATLETTPIKIGAIGMGEFARDIYPRYVVVDTPEELSSLLIPFVSQMTSCSE